MNTIIMQTRENEFGETTPQERAAPYPERATPSPERAAPYPERATPWSANGSFPISQSGLNSSPHQGIT